MSSSTAGAEEFSGVVAWPGRILSIKRGRRFILALASFYIALLGLVLFSRGARGAPLFRFEDGFWSFSFAFHIWMLTLPRGHGYSREGVCGWGDRERPWSDVRRVIFRGDHVEFDIGKRFFWQRPWLIPPEDAYERARFELTLAHFVPEDRIVRDASGN